MADHNPNPTDAGASDRSVPHGKAADAWGDCPDGLLTACGRRRRAQINRRAALQNGGVAAIAAALFVVAITLPGGPEHAGITCRQCVARFDDFAASLKADAGVDAVVSERLQSVAGHLAACPKCRAAFTERYPDLPLGPAMAAATAAALLTSSRRPLVSVRVRRRRSRRG